MSLKAFHVLFVIISTVGAVAFGWWSFSEYMKTEAITSAVIGVFSILSAVVLLVYGFWVLKKLRNFSWL